MSGDPRVTVDTEAAKERAEKIIDVCAKHRALNERRDHADRGGLLLSARNVEPVARDVLALAARLEAAETALRSIHETADWYAKNDQRLAHEVDRALCIDVLSYAEEGLAALAADRGEPIGGSEKGSGVPGVAAVSDGGIDVRGVAAVRGERG